MEKAIEWATSEGFESMYLDTVPAAMPEANRLYASLGFTPGGTLQPQSRWPNVEFFSQGIDRNVR